MAERSCNHCEHKESSHRSGGLCELCMPPGDQSGSSSTCQRFVPPSDDADSPEDVRWWVRRLREQETLTDRWRALAVSQRELLARAQPLVAGLDARDGHARIAVAREIGAMLDDQDGRRSMELTIAQRRVCEAAALAARGYLSDVCDCTDDFKCSSCALDLALSNLRRIYAGHRIPG